MAANYDTRLKVTKRHDDGSLSVQLPFRKTGEAFRGFETWELFESDARGHLNFSRAADVRECAVLDAAIRANPAHAANKSA
jgi:hypothetical protein